MKPEPTYILSDSNMIPPDSNREQRPAMLELEKEERINRIYLGNSASLSVSFIPRLLYLGIFLEIILGQLSYGN